MNSLEDFQAHVELHRERVVRLGMALAKEKFPEIDMVALEAFLRQHDLSKTIRRNANDLYLFYGRDGKGPEFNSIRNRINEFDQIVRNNFFAHHSEISASHQEIFYLVEHVADLVDRGIDPVAAEEFGHKLSPASRFLKDQRFAGFAKWLENSYNIITQDLSLPGEH
ncbi:MAG TPA: hypothetical protein VN132_13855, partial [Bdellovibrio sp.]|nr:hypothetical protein [Bdellovibrio sp.]